MTQQGKAVFIIQITSLGNCSFDWQRQAALSESNKLFLVPRPTCQKNFKRIHLHFLK